MPDSVQATRTPIERVLRLAAELWMQDHPAEYRRDSYSTAANEFLWAAERAYFDASKAFG